MTKMSKQQKEKGRKTFQMRDVCSVAYGQMQFTQQSIDRLRHDYLILN